MKDSNNNKMLRKNLKESVSTLLDLIEGVERDIERSQQLSDSFLLKQYCHLKKDYTQQLLNLLNDYGLPFQLKEVA